MPPAPWKGVMINEGERNAWKGNMSDNWDSIRGARRREEEWWREGGRSGEPQIVHHSTTNFGKKNLWRNPPPLCLVLQPYWILEWNDLSFLVGRMGQKGSYKMFFGWLGLLFLLQLTGWRDGRKGRRKENGATDGTQLSIKELLVDQGKQEACSTVQQTLAMVSIHSRMPLMFLSSPRTRT